ncbi:fungal-specific transcription factor domain-containing protein [Aspergillus bertholletiae]|uniref:Fungal-specific transcription factor domain-containing protein n=1 Tax=Aspergillus bertholletiae TaxID=1226010 RepID=A0A5N7BGY4_9EURO|nr:fungal-specific transcription factor domain-containing protein [Aspergillus bertholletiae]
MSVTQRCKTGCWTCRLRRKKCNEDGQPCSNCEARGIFCHGYGPRPSWKDRGEKERQEAKRLQLQTRARGRRVGTTPVSEGRRPSIDASPPGTGTPIRAGRSPSISSLGFEPLDIPDLASVLWDPTLDIIQVKQTAFDKLPGLPESPSSLRFPSVLADDMEEKEIELIMYYISEAFPNQHSLGEKSSLVERSWLLCVLKRSPSFYYTSLSLSAYYRLLNMPQHDQDRPALSQDFEKYKTRSLYHFQELLNSTQSQPPVATGRVIGESVICGVQIAMLEAVSKNMQSSYLHLGSAALSLAQQLEPPLPDSYVVPANLAATPALDLTTGPYRAQSMENKAVRFFSTVLIWNDILHCSARQSVPTVAETYRNLLEDENFAQLFLDTVGCEGWVLFPILEALLLSQWKQEQEAQGKLSIRELITKVDGIESTLQARIERLGQSIFKTGDAPQGQQDIRLIQTYIFAHASVVDLHTIASGAQPSVPEIQQSIEKSISAWQLLPPSMINLKTMAWPFYVCGSLAVGSQREQFQKMISHHFQNQSTSSSFHCLRSVVEECWKNFDRRESGQNASSYNWKAVMEELNMSILFI